ncbi:peptide ABC transporter substrate-binding protein [Rhodocista pekingensis]|uniref:Peptide ABC transporter substrate-binding protein n=1 Tax=Rhodocista pekingensis TaxID=201185 RepID=A0ABW2KWZ5_9PROT
MTPFFRRLALAVTLTAGFAAAALPALAETAIRRGIGSAPRTIDPHRADLVQEGWIDIDMFEGLLSLDAKGQTRLALAAAMDLSADGTVYTFTLREDAKFSDGSPVTADDVVFSFQRLADPKTLSPYAYFAWPIVNGREITAGEKPPSALGIEAVDPRTVRITLIEPTGYFAGQLSHSSMSVVKKANVEQYGDAFIQPGKMVASGPYVLVEAVPQGHFKLAKNPHYYDADQVRIDTVYHVVTESADTEFKQFRAGELDATYTLPVTQHDFAKKNLPEAFRPTEAFSTYQFWINMTKEPWKSEPKLRLALLLAADTTVLAEKVVGAGTRPAFTFVPPDSVPGYTSPVPDWASLSSAERDAMAKTLIAEAGYGPGGKPLPKPELLFSTNENNRRIAIAIAAMWKQKLGVEAVLNNQEGRVVASIADDKAYKDMLFFGWNGDYLDPVTFLKLLRSDVAKQNYAGYRNPEFDRLVDLSNVETDPAKRLALLAQAEALALRDVPMILTHHLTRRRLVSPRVLNWNPNPRDYYPTRYLDIAKERG